MSFTRSTTNTSVHQGMPDYPSSQGYTTTQLKQAFDAPAEGLQQDLNGLCTELEDTSAAGNIGATAIDPNDTSNGTVQDKLDFLQSELQGITLGQIPPGTITSTELDSTYEATLAKKDGTLQTGLDTEKLNSKTEAQLKTAFLATPNPTTISFTGATKQTPTVTETKTYSSNGSRYYIMLFSYKSCKIGLFDAQTENFVAATYLGASPDNLECTYAFNSNNIDLHKGGAAGKVTLGVTYSSGTITLNVTKAPSQSSSGSNTPSGSITIFELGGIV